MRKVSAAFSPVVAVDRQDARPLHKQLCDAFKGAILRGEIAPGQQVTSSRSLARELRISRIPILNAYAQLTAEGYFASRGGAGTFVSESLPGLTDLAKGRQNRERRERVEDRTVSQRALTLPDRTKAPWAYGAGAFSVGQLAFEEFPIRIWSNLIGRHARKIRSTSLNYGDSLGLKDFRETIAAYLRTSRAVHCDASQILVVSGSQQALDISARVLLDAGDRVWVEDPSYGLMQLALALAGCELVPVPVDENGLNVTAGIKLCREAKAAYITPSHQFPLGVTMSAARRLQLLEWAQKHDSWVVEDDYDSEYRYESMPIPSLQGLDHDSRVIYIGTFSKTLFPALRLGYMVVPPDLVDRFAALRRILDIFPSYFHQEVMTEFIQQGHFARHLRRTRMLYAERRRVLVDAIGNELGPQFEIAGGKAGMHVVVLVPEGMRDAEIAVRAAQQKLWLWPLSTSYLGKVARQGFILGFGGVQVDGIPAAVRRLKSAITA